MSIFGKFFEMLYTAQVNLLRNRVRTVLTVIAIFVGSFTISLVSALNTGVNDYIDRQLSAIGGNEAIFVTPKQQNIQSPGPKEYVENDGKASTTNQSSSIGNGLEETDRQKIQAIKHVKSVHTVKTITATYIQHDDGKKYEFSAIGSPEIKLDVLAGKMVDNDASDYEIDIEADYLEPLGLIKLNGNKDLLEDRAHEAIGKTVKVVVQSAITKKTQEFDMKIAGILNKSLIGGGKSTVNSKTFDAMQNFMLDGIPDSMRPKASSYQVSLDHGVTLDQIADTKAQIIEAGYQASTVSDIIGTVKSIIDAITWVLLAFAAIALLAAAFGIINTLYMSVLERTREIGLMKSLGMSSKRVFTSFSIEAILIGFWGSFVAIIASLGIGSAVNIIAKQSFLKDLPGFTLMKYTPQDIVTVMFIIMLIAFLSGTLPSKKASKQNPIDALRYE
ncbi:MAG: ABC transporter permease [Candidatus Ancillula sp.]|jgi:putative ABC transport system permease protein|nr:ABC transporter permease [Candidatus Ancillula sp.]